MSDLVSGKNVIVYIWDAPVWKLYACAKSCTLSIATEMIETSVSGQGRFGTFIPGKITFTGTIEGTVSLEAGSDLNFPDLQQRQLNDVLLLMRFQRTSKGGIVYTSEVKFYISNSTDVGSFDNMDLFTIELRGTGVPVQIFTAQPPTPNTTPVKRVDYTGSGGELFFISSLLIGKSIIEVVKDGQGRANIITSGTPVNQEVKYTTGTGTITFAQPFETGEHAYVIYQDM